MGRLCYSFPLFALLVTSASAQLQPTHAHLPYGLHARQKLDLYLPASGALPRPLVIWIHGGGWQSGDKYPASKASVLLSAGFAVASINYRLSSDATFPAQSHDCKAAIRWLRAHADDYGLDPCRFGVWGSSAGGHLAALMGVSGGVEALEGEVGGNLVFPSRVQAAADYFGPSDLFTMGGGHDLCTSPESLMLGVCLGDVKAHLTDPAWAGQVAHVLAASPIFHVDPRDPPFHIAHGTADPVVPVAQSESFHAALESAGVMSTLRLIDGAGHELPTSEDAFVRDFFLLHLGTPRPAGDVTCDGMVTLDDYAALAACLTGPQVAGTAVPLGCDAMAFKRVDSDLDGDVDLRDFASWLAPS